MAQVVTMALGGAYARLGEVGKARTTLAGIEPIIAKLGRETLFYGIFLRAQYELATAERRFADAATNLNAAEKIFVAIGASAKPFAESIGPLRARLAKEMAVVRPT